jgi:hypothetical protein
MTEELTNKDRFVAKLRGEPFGKDMFGNDLYVGDFIIYGTMHGSSSALKVGRIVKVKVKQSAYSKEPSTQISISVRGASKGYNWKTRESGWTVQDRVSSLSNLSSNVILWKDPEEAAVKLLEAADA